MHSGRGPGRGVAEAQRQASMAGDCRSDAQGGRQGLDHAELASHSQTFRFYSNEMGAIEGSSALM